MGAENSASEFDYHQDDHQHSTMSDIGHVTEDGFAMDKTNQSITDNQMFLVHPTRSFDSFQ